MKIMLKIEKDSTRFAENEGFLIFFKGLVPWKWLSLKNSGTNPDVHRWDSSNVLN